MVEIIEPPQRRALDEGANDLFKVLLPTRGAQREPIL